MGTAALWLSLRQLSSGIDHLRPRGHAETMVVYIARGMRKRATSTRPAHIHKRAPCMQMRGSKRFVYMGCSALFILLYSPRCGGERSVGNTIRDYECRLSLISQKTPHVSPVASSCATNPAAASMPSRPCESSRSSIARIVCGSVGASPNGSNRS